MGVSIFPREARLYLQLDERCRSLTRGFHNKLPVFPLDFTIVSTNSPTHHERDHDVHNIFADVVLAPINRYFKDWSYVSIVIKV